MAALDLIEEAVHVLRRLPVSAWLEFMTGCIPFALGLLYFWADMSRGAYAESRLATSTLALVGLYFWMKYWQSMFARSLRSVVHGHPQKRPTWRERRNILLLNAAVHPTGLLILPLTFVLMLPFPHAFAFYHNLTVFADGENGSLRHNANRAWKMARMWFGQNLAMLMAMQLFVLFVYFNWHMMAVMIPSMLKTLLGLETAFSRAGKWASANTTFTAAMIVLTWLCISPFMRAIYTLRCFYGEALQTGEDLRAELKFLRSTPLSQVAVLTLLGATMLTSFPNRALSAETKPAAQRRLDKALDKVLEKPVFSWRMPREQATNANEKDLGWIGNIMRSIAESTETFGLWIKDQLKALIDWIDQVFSRKPQLPEETSGSNAGWQDNVRTFVYLLLILAAAALVVLLIRLWRQRPVTVAVAEPVIPDLNDEDVAPDDLPEDEWLRMAHELFAKGDTRLALRALYLACLAHLGERELVTISRAKSNREYQRELNRRARLLEEIRAAFHQNVTEFERVWYGLHEVTRGRFEQFEGNLRKIRTC